MNKQYHQGGGVFVSAVNRPTSRGQAAKLGKLSFQFSRGSDRVLVIM